jgi:hypothetical protein
LILANRPAVPYRFGISHTSDRRNQQIAIPIGLPQNPAIYFPSVSAGRLLPFRQVGDIRNGTGLIRQDPTDFQCSFALATWSGVIIRGGGNR